jgi:deoxyuridine 5'-triphosphate nucleotidohydrolase
MADTWYELEILALNPQDITFYSEKEYNRSDENAGFDLYAADNVHIQQTPQLIPFGIVCRLLKVVPMPNGMPHEVMKTDSHFWLAPRSSIFKSGLIMANSMGVIDKSYRGELKAPVWSMTGDSNVSRGDRLFQIVAPDMGWIRNVRMVDSIPGTTRGAGGFGSTGK